MTIHSITGASPSTAVRACPPLGPERLDGLVTRALTAWLGAWPSPGVLRVVPSARRLLPEDGDPPQPLVALFAGEDMDGAAVVSVAPPSFTSVGTLVQELAARRALGDRHRLISRLPESVGHPDAGCIETVMRWTTAPPAFRRIGQWQRPDDPTLPAWLPAGDGKSVLVARGTQGKVVAGIALQRRGEWLRELVTATAPGANRTHMLERLLAQAAEDLLAQGFVPFLRHDAADTDKAGMADAAGLTDRGWHLVRLSVPVAEEGCGVTSDNSERVFTISSGVPTVGTCPDPAPSTTSRSSRPQPARSETSDRPG